MPAYGDPVRCGLSIQSLASLEYWVTRQLHRAAFDDPVAGDDVEYAFAISRRNTPEVCISILPSSKAEGAGKTGCALHPRSRVQLRTEKRTRAYRFSGNTPAFPAQWLYGLLRALPGERLFCHRRPREACFSRNLTPAPRRQDHTTSPYASCALVCRAHFASTASRPNVRDDRATPLLWDRMARVIALICPTG